MPQFWGIGLPFPGMVIDRRLLVHLRDRLACRLSCPCRGHRLRQALLERFAHHLALHLSERAAVHIINVFLGQLHFKRPAYDRPWPGTYPPTWVWQSRLMRFCTAVEERSVFTPGEFISIDDKADNFVAARRRHWNAAIWTGKDALDNLLDAAIHILAASVPPPSTPSSRRQS